ncbi:Chloride channel protein CLC-f [Camellia lanceoleosa]|uniref:Chloride channel protein CLC-f n=1 Tax=Camellia lanceoleosa TaxID=1840588 RepID=A0ACC0GJL6_9ERIC|nr:Chloride channel protein CLC-f [Camellia lanceoleosa]
MWRALSRSESESEVSWSSARWKSSGGGGCGIDIDDPGVLHKSCIALIGRLLVKVVIVKTAQLVTAKVFAIALCKGSGLVGGLYAPSLMIGAVVGAIFCGSIVELINSAILGNVVIAQQQAYALGCSFCFPVRFAGGDGNDFGVR